MNDKINQKISEVLGIDPASTPPAPIKIETMPVVAPKTKLEILADKPLDEVIIDEDFNEARENLKDIIATTKDAIAKLQMIADESESPRSFEVLEKLLRQASDANDKLLNLSKQRRELTKGLPQPQHQRQVSEPQVVKQDIQNAIFVGTSADLDDVLEARRSKKMEKDIIDVQLPAGPVQDQE